MPILGLDAAACDLLLRLLAADPAARPSAAQVLRHPWLAEVAGVVAAPAQRGGPPGGLEELRRTASELARLGFAAGDREPLQEALQRCAAPLSASAIVLCSQPCTGVLLGAQRPGPGGMAVLLSHRFT